MKKRNMILFLFLSCVFIHKINAQDKKVLSVTLSLEDDTLFLLEPWQFKVEIKNTCNVDIELMPTEIIGGWASKSAEIKLEIKNNNHKDWVDTKAIINWCNIEGFKFYNLKPNESIIYKFNCPPPLGLLETGHNEVRISYANLCNHDNTYYSLSDTMYIAKYEGQDLEAYNYLTRLPDPKFILFPVINTPHDTSSIANVEYVVQNFSNSYLAEYGKLYLSYQYLERAHFELVQASSAELILYQLRNSKKIALSLLTTKNKQILDKTHSLLQIHLFEIAVRAYKYDLPDDIQEEFTFPFKN